MLREEATHAAYPGLTAMPSGEQVAETVKPVEVQQQVRYSVYEGADPQNIN